MTLPKRSDIGRLDREDRSLIDLAVRYQPRLDQFAQSIEFSTIWSEITTPAGRVVSRLAPSGRPIGGNGYGGARGWNTPTSDDVSQRTKRYAQGGHALSLQAGMASWPTPQAKEQKERPETKTARGAHAGLNLRDAAEMSAWRTPTHQTENAGQDPEKRKKGNHCIGIQDEATLYATSGATPSGSPEQTERRGASRGALNPAFVSWLMGYPIEWTLAGLAVKPKRSRSLSRTSPTGSDCSAAMETPS